MTTLYHEVHGILSLFLTLARGVVDDSKLKALEAAFDNPAPDNPGLTQTVVELSNALTLFNNRARRAGEAIADAIDEIEDELKDGTDWVIEPSLAEALLSVRRLIRGESTAPGTLAGGGEVSNPSTCWPNCLPPGGSSGGSSGSGSTVYGGGPPPCGC